MKFNGTLLLTKIKLYIVDSKVNLFKVPKSNSVGLHPLHFIQQLGKRQSSIFLICVCMLVYSKSLI